MSQIETTLSGAQPGERQGHQPPAARNAQPEYRPPRMFEIGTAEQLLRRDGTGHLRDGTGDWWVWGS